MPEHSDSLRATLAETIDTRALATRRRLIEAFRQVAHADSQAVNVSKICQLAEVGRSTFYTHFATVDDLAVAAMTASFADVSPLDVARRTDHLLSGHEIARLGLSEIVAALSDPIKLLSRSTSTTRRGALRRGFVDELARLTRPTVRTELPDADDFAVDLICGYTAAGIAEVLELWAERPETDRQVIVEHLLALIPPFMTAGR